MTQRTTTSASGGSGGMHTRTVTYNDYVHPIGMTEVMQLLHVLVQEVGDLKKLMYRTYLEQGLIALTEGDTP